MNEFSHHISREKLVRYSAMEYLVVLTQYATVTDGWMDRIAIA